MLVIVRIRSLKEHRPIFSRDMGVAAQAMIHRVEVEILKVVVVVLLHVKIHQPKRPVWLLGEM